MMKYEYIQILVRTTHYGIHLNVMNSNCCLHTSERLFGLENLPEWECRTRNLFCQLGFKRLVGVRRL